MKLKKTQTQTQTQQTYDFKDGNGPVPAHRHINPDGGRGGWVADTATVTSTVYVKKDAKVSGDARVTGHAQVSGDARVTGHAQVSGNAIVSGIAQVYDNAKVYGDAQVTGHAIVYGDARVYDNAKVSDNAKVYGDARVYGNAIISGTTHFKIGHYLFGIIDDKMLMLIYNDYNYCGFYRLVYRFAGGNQIKKISKDNILYPIIHESEQKRYPFNFMEVLCNFYDVEKIQQIKVNTFKIPHKNLTIAVLKDKILFRQKSKKPFTALCETDVIGYFFQ